MPWVKTPTGAINMDHLIRAEVVGDNGDVRLHFGPDHYQDINVGANAAHALFRLQTLIRAQDPFEFDVPPAGSAPAGEPAKKPNKQ